MRALVLGRFQPPHRGHLHAIRSAARRYGEVLVAVGSAQYSHERRNPFTVGERFQLLQAGLRDVGLRHIHLYAVPDLHKHAAWVAHLESLLPDFDVVITNNPLTRRLFSKAGYRVVAGSLWRPDACSGRRIRALWARGQDASHLLTPSVHAAIEKIQGPQRVRHLATEAHTHRRR